MVDTKTWSMDSILQRTRKRKSKRKTQWGTVNLDRWCGVAYTQGKLFPNTRLLEGRQQEGELYQIIDTPRHRIFCVPNVLYNISQLMLWLCPGSRFSRGLNQGWKVKLARHKYPWRKQRSWFLNMGYQSLEETSTAESSIYTIPLRSGPRSIFLKGDLPTKTTKNTRTEAESESGQTTLRTSRNK